MVLISLSGFLSGKAQRPSSVLAEGTWFKIGVTRTGVYKLDAAFFARNGIALSGVDPRTIRMFGNGGTPLPQANDRPRPQDLAENAVWVTGETDGRFDTGDVVYFLAESPHAIRYDSTAGRLTHETNPYSDTTFYFLNIGLKTGKRIATSTFTAPAAPVLTTFDDYAFYQAGKDLTNLVKSGRDWLEYLGAGIDKVLSFSLPGIVPNTPALVTSDVVGRSTTAGRFQLKWGTQTVGTQEIESVSDYIYDRKGRRSLQTFTLTTAPVENPARLTLSYDRTGQGYLRSIAVQTRRDLRRYEDQTVFRSLAALRLPAVRYTIRQADAAMQVWDITDRRQPVGLPVTLNAGQEGTVAAQGGSYREYLIFSPQQAYEPESVLKIVNQNLRAQPAPNLLIVTPDAWRDQAQRLADLRRKKDGLEVLVVSSREVYNEFASGQPDPTAIRDLARYYYRQSSGQLNYLLLFGDASYDYRNAMKLLTQGQQAALIPTYESRESLHPVLSFSSDDYFGFMEAKEGEWAEDFSGDHTLDLGVGRLPVNTAVEARALVDKLIRYAETGRLPGDWRTRITFVADDGDRDFPNIHQTDADKLARQLAASRPAFRIEKLYLDRFPQESGPAGQKAPAVNEAIRKALNDGRLIVNYTGHGGESGWAEEQVVTLQDILAWSNRPLPLLVTATCQFGRYDDPAQTSGAELALLNARGGSIALLTTARPVYASTNYLLNRAFYDALAGTTADGAPRLGDLMRLTKNGSLSGSLNRNFTLLGDPSMQLAYPEAKVVLTRINGKAAGRDTLKALETVRLEGEIQQKGQRLDGFTGQVKITLFDKTDTVNTRGTEFSPPMAYTEYRSPLYTGQASVRNGRFSLAFVLPKDIDYRTGSGKLFAYALRSDSLLEAAGSYDSLQIGGSAPNPVADGRGPDIRLFINDTTFTDGGTVSGPGVTLIARLSDENGINIASNSIGHELTLILNDNSPIPLNDFFVPERDDHRRGTVRYTWPKLPPGSYTVNVKAWDTYNNPTTAALNFVVSGQPSLSIQTVQVAPNPFQEKATFRVRHNRPGDDLTLTLTVADLSGRTVSQQTIECAGCDETLPEFGWNGSMTSGAPVDRGLYVYRLLLHSRTDGSSVTNSGKLLYLR
ncbi:type IX secretion system sortase PorU [Larkinella soli]|uniref:type IX secretion system sortase PorU n=1 Tax=Larkinella soli TaxID=1770527 RepID=UPI000FFC58CD|nr:type IX secretion system sortase PorU [Larkinella soli]